MAVALFQYKALSAQGETLQGSMEAGSAEEVAARLQDQGHLPLDMRRGDTPDAGGLLALSFGSKALNQAEITQLTQQLATLLGAGLPLDRALGTLMDLPERESARRVIERIREAVRGGMPLSAAMDQEHGLFSRLYVSMVRAGETGGGLQLALSRLGEYLERAQNLRASIISALIYPAILVLMVGLASILLLGFIVPQFNTLLVDMQVELPWYSSVVMSVGMGLRSYWWLLLGISAVVIGIVLFKANDPQSRASFDRWILQRKLVGGLIARIETARLARTLGTLLNNGVPLLTALNFAAPVIGNRALADALVQASEEVKVGSGLSYALNKSKLFPRLAIQMIQVGEESGELDRMLLKVADTFDTETQQAVQRLLAALVPVLTILMAMLVALVVLSVLVPLYNLTSGAGAL